MTTLITAAKETIQFGDYFWSGDHLLSNLGIISGPGNISGTQSFAGLYRAFQSG